jgi:hypothetical protein
MNPFDLTTATATEQANLRSHLQKAAIARSEYLRLELTRQALTMNLWATDGRFLLLPPEQCLTEAYGENAAAKFWRAYLSTTRALVNFIALMALFASSNGQQEQVQRLMLRRALKAAFDLGIEGFDRASSFDDRMKLDPRRVTRWLVDHPLYSELVPASLSEYVGRVPHVVVTPAIAWLRNRKKLVQQMNEPAPPRPRGRGRPRKAA